MLWDEVWDEDDPDHSLENTSCRCNPEQKERTRSIFSKIPSTMPSIPSSLSTIQLESPANSAPMTHHNPSSIPSIEKSYIQSCNSYSTKRQDHEIFAIALDPRRSMRQLGSSRLNIELSTPSPSVEPVEHFANGLWKTSRRDESMKSISLILRV
jgi:hypothetical protein